MLPLTASVTIVAGEPWRFTAFICLRVDEDTRLASERQDQIIGLTAPQIALSSWPGTSASRAQTFGQLFLAMLPLSIMSLDMASLPIVLPFIAHSSSENGIPLMTHASSSWQHNYDFSSSPNVTLHGTASSLRHVICSCAPKRKSLPPTQLRARRPRADILSFLFS